MKHLKRLYHFLGGVYFALILISSTAFFVIAGTFIESSTQSHRYAALFTYDNPLFAALLWGFFINILFSATRRWPFRWKHVPFLTTHLGLLMILAGVLAKHYFGVQGSMSLLEGSGSDAIMQSGTYAIHVEKKGDAPEEFPIKTMGGRNPTIAHTHEGLRIHLAEFSPHCKDHLATWIKGSHAFIRGLKPMPLIQASNEEESIPPSGMIPLHHPDYPAWELYALKTADIAKTVTKLYSQNARIIVSDKLSHEILMDRPLPTFSDGTLALNFSSQEGFQNPEITMKYPANHELSIPLDQDHALLNLHSGSPFEHAPLAVDIAMRPLLALIEDEFQDTFLVAFDPHGKVWSAAFRKGIPDHIVAYDDGFAGYTVQAKIPAGAYKTGREEREKALAQQLTVQLREAGAKGTELSPPLKLFQEACYKSGSDFSLAITEFLQSWNDTHQWLYPENLPLSPELKKVFAKLEWDNTAAKRGSEWTLSLFDQIAPDLKVNPLLQVLRKHGWPLLRVLEAEIHQNKEPDSTISEYILLTRQLFAAAESPSFKYIPSMDHTERMPETQASLLSAYLLAYGIHLSSILPIPTGQIDALIHEYHQAEHENTPMILETAVIPVPETIPANTKLEDNIPKITLFIDKGKRRQSLSLAYDRTGSGLKWPILDGEYLIRFQPQFKHIPYRLRLRQARQINYPNSSQPYSFESDLIFKDSRNNETKEKTISMNQVHETWDGYRFYLSSINQPNETSVKNVIIVVNHDPAKYWLTYPGAIVLSCGILMLFILRPYRQSKR